MNRLQTYAGTMPVYLGDLDWMQDAYSDAFSCLIQALANVGGDSANIILQGVEISNPEVGRFSWTSGVVSIAGELLRVEAGSAEVARETSLFVHIQAVFSGSRTFRDGQEHACHEERSAVLSADGAGGISISNFVRLHVSTDRTYNSANTLPGGGTARLMRRAGLWYIEAPLTLQQAEQTIGNVVFSVSRADLSLFSSMDFPATVILMDPDDQYHEQLIAVSIRTSSSPVSVSIGFDFANEQTTFGEGYIRLMLPIF